MLNFISKAASKIFGSKSEKDIKGIMPYVEATNKIYATLSSLSDDELRAKSAAIKDDISTRLKEIDDEIAKLTQKVEDNEELPLEEKEAIFNQIDSLEEKRNEELEKILLDVLPDTFAVVKETARRFAENEGLKVNASMHDKMLAQTRDFVSIEGDKAVWGNTWKAAGNDITWNMIHYDVQLIGGVVLHTGKIAEMATGEGKTLVSTLPAFLNALAGRGVHIVTVNNYLALRDAEWNAPLFAFHGLTVDCIDKHQPGSEARIAAYNADITYGTNNEFGFDYLRDNMARDTRELVQRKHHYAIIDEVDSVLIDEARTPLIISGPVPRGDEHEFYELKPRIAKLVEEQKKLISQFLIDAKKKIAAGDTKEGGLALFRAFRGLPKYKPLIKYLSETGIRALLQKTENFYLQDNSKMMPEADEPLLFTIDEKNNNIELTEKGLENITKTGEDPNFFILPDIGVAVSQIEQDQSLDDEDKIVKKDAIIKDYSAKAQRIHTVNQLLKAYTLFEKDTEYIIADGKVKIVDEQTGRVLDGRRYSDGLHQAIEAKENVKIEDATQTYATITLQNYFRMYHKLAGMTGTAETEAGELWEIYKLDVVVIPTNRPIVRSDQNDKVYKTAREKFNAVIDEIVELTEAGRPVLVGTTSVEISEVVSRMLNLRKIKHQVLNAKQHQREAEVVAEAGKPGTVTIATNMAGRGTDIKLTPESKAAGGLAIIGTERHESRRVDRQLRGRSGRQGDPGSSQFFVSLEDNLMRLFGSDRMAKLMDRLGLKEGEVIQAGAITKSIERAQKKVEENNFGIRKRLLEYDDVMNSQREVIYTRRKNALYGDRLEVDVLNTFYDVCEEIANDTMATMNYEGFRLNCLSTLGIDVDISEDDLKAMSNDVLTQTLFNKALTHYREKNKIIRDRSAHVFKEVQKNRGATVKNIQVPMSDGKKTLGVICDLNKAVESHGLNLIRGMEKYSTLAFIDQAWKEHLREMDDLKQSVQNAVYEQKDPLLIYKFEAFEMFKRFTSRINNEITSFLMKADLPQQQPADIQEARELARQRYNEEKEETRSAFDRGRGNRPPAEKQMPAKSDKKYGRNDRVTVQYTDGTVKKDVKFKAVEEDLFNNRCVVVEN